MTTKIHIIKEYSKSLRLTAALFDSLAEIELQGAKWIMSLPLEMWTEYIKKHAQEELNHAMALRSVAQECRNYMSASGLKVERTINAKGIPMAKRYAKLIFVKVMKDIFRGPTMENDSRRLAYVLVGLLLEMRVQKIYQHFVFNGQIQSVRDYSHSILDDGKHHIIELKKILAFNFGKIDISLGQLFTYEEEKFNEWMDDYFNEVIKHINQEPTLTQNRWSLINPQALNQN